MRIGPNVEIEGDVVYMNEHPLLLEAVEQGLLTKVEA
jgi:hypothetical protein